MGTRNLETASKVTFVGSLALLAFLYGFVAHAAGWFPSAFLERAWSQLQRGRGESVPSFVTVRVHDWAGARTVAPTRVQPGLTLVSSMWKDSANGSWKPGFTLIDRDGTPVHRWRFDPRRIHPSGLAQPPRGTRYPHGSVLFPNGDIVFNIWDITARVNACGELIWRLQARGHHSVAKMEDGTYWVPGRTGPDEDSLRATRLPRLGTPSSQNLLMHLGEGGVILERMNVLELVHENGLGRLIAKNEIAKREDVTHVNDIEPLADSLADEYPLFEAGDLLVSLRDLDLVMVLDPETRRVRWSAYRPFIAQHDPDFLGNGWIGVFDNNQDQTFRGAMLGGSRIVALQPHTDSLDVRYSPPEGESFYSNFGGNWQLLRNGNMLLTETTAGRILEVTPTGETVWEWAHRPYDNLHVPEVYSAQRYDLTAEEVAEWTCGQGDSTARPSE